MNLNRKKMKMKRKKLLLNRLLDIFINNLYILFYTLLIYEMKSLLDLGRVH